MKFSHQFILLRSSTQLAEALSAVSVVLHSRHVTLSLRAFILLLLFYFIFLILINFFNILLIYCFRGATSTTAPRASQSRCANDTHPTNETRAFTLMSCLLPACTSMRGRAQGGIYERASLLVMPTAGVHLQMAIDRTAT